MSAPLEMPDGIVFTLDDALARCGLIAVQDATGTLTERLDAGALVTVVNALAAEREKVRVLERALYPLVVEALRAECCDDAPEYVNNEPYEGMLALPECVPCAGTGATDHKHYEDVPIPDEVRCAACDGWGFLMHAALAATAEKGESKS